MTGWIRCNLSAENPTFEALDTRMSASADDAKIIVHKTDNDNNGDVDTLMMILLVSQSHQTG
jgi:hypothetical protein